MGRGVLFGINPFTTVKWTLWYLLRLVVYLYFIFLIYNCKYSADYYQEAYRPQYHFSPEKKWMNDPNGLVYLDGEYHLFYQYYPDSTVWGPMHWGHAVSNDLITWKHLPIALYPDSLGYIFSGSAVADTKNMSGFRKNDEIPLVAIFTYHNQVYNDQQRVDVQTQGIAWSIDRGRTWQKYKNNPVIQNPGIFNFRDPKVIWYQPANKWIMVVAVNDRVYFYSSTDLKVWESLSAFGRIGSMSLYNPDCCFVSNILIIYYLKFGA